MLQGQKKSYEAKMEEYEALQLQKKVSTDLSHFICVIVESVKTPHAPI